MYKHNSPLETFTRIPYGIPMIRIKRILEVTQIMPYYAYDDAELLVCRSNVRMCTDSLFINQDRVL